MQKVITVKPRKITFNKGDVYYTGSLEYTERHVVQGPPVQEDPGIWFVPVMSTNIGNVCKKDSWVFDYGIAKEGRLFPGDQGVPGYTYDNRPCTLAFTVQGAHDKAMQKVSWRLKCSAEKRNYLKSLNVDFE